MQHEPQNEPTAGKPEWAKTAKDRRRERGEKPSRLGWILLGVVVIAGAGFAVVSQKPAGADTDVAVVEEVKVKAKYLAQEEVMTLAPMTLQRQIKVTGTVEPQNVSQLPALISAQVDRVNVRPGDAVKKGDLLVAMDTESLEIQKEQQLSAIQATEAQLFLAESQLKRTQDLSKQGIAPSSQLEQARSTVDAQKANLQAQRSQIKATDYQLRNANIFAPVTGVVSARNAEPGMFVGVGNPLMEIVDLSVMELKVNVSTADSARIRKGLKVALSIEGLPNVSVTGTITRISPVANRGTRTIPVFIEIDNRNGQLRGGMFAIGQITLEAKPNSLAIPKSAVHTNADGSAYVLRVDNNTAVEQPVSLAGEWGEQQWLEVTDGLSAGDTIVILPLLGLMSGDAVELIGE